MVSTLQIFYTFLFVPALDNCTSRLLTICPAASMLGCMALLYCITVSCALLHLL